MSTCERWQQRITECAADDPLPSDIRVHVETCEACAQVLLQERHVRGAMAAIAWPATPASVTAEAVSERARRTTDEAVFPRTGLWLLAFVGMGMLAVLGLLVLIGPSWLTAKDYFGPAVVVGSIIAAGLGWTGFDAADRRVQRLGSPSGISIGVGLARAALVAALVLIVMNSAIRGGWERSLFGLAGGPAEAGGTAYQAALICASTADGSMRMTTWDQGCREGEQIVPSGAGALPGGPALLPTVEYRAGTVTIPAGRSHVQVAFTRSMPTGGYHVTTSVSEAHGSFAQDEACRFTSIAGKSTEGFGITLRRCWFEGEDVPEDRTVEDLTLDWIAIESR